MLSLHKQIRNFGIGLLLLAFLLFPSSSFGQQPVCFDPVIAGKMLVALEQAKIAEQQIVNLEGSSAELQEQKEILKNTVKLLQEQMEVYKNMAEMQNKLSETKDKLHKEELKAATPSFFEKLGMYMTGAGVGAVGAVLLMLFL